MANRAAQVGDGGSLSDWYREVPPITKFFITGTLLTASLTQFGLLGFIGGPGGLLFDWNLIASKFHIWRLVTPFVFAGGFGLPFVFHMFILYENCRRYEANPFNTGAGGTSADFFYMLVVGGGMLMVLEILLGFGMSMMSEPILYYIVYVWSRRDPDSMVNIWGVKFKAMYLPWVYCAIRVVMNGPVQLILLGIGVGHLYYFLVDVCPAQHGYELIKTPKWCIDFMTYLTNVTQGNPNVFVPPGRQRQQTGGVFGTAQPAAGTANAPPTAANDGLRNRGGGYQWGRGNVLGSTGN